MEECRRSERIAGSERRGEGRGKWRSDEGGQLRASSHKAMG
jgi:hypothetical protein